MKVIFLSVELQDLRPVYFEFKIVAALNAVARCQVRSLLEDAPEFFLHILTSNFEC